MNFDRLPNRSERPLLKSRFAGSSSTLLWQVPFPESRQHVRWKKTWEVWDGLSAESFASAWNSEQPSPQALSRPREASRRRLQPEDFFSWTFKPRPRKRQRRWNWARLYCGDSTAKCCESASLRRRYLTSLKERRSKVRCICALGRKLSLSVFARRWKGTITSLGLTDPTVITWPKAVI